MSTARGLRMVSAYDIVSIVMMLAGVLFAKKHKVIYKCGEDDSRLSVMNSNKHSTNGHFDKKMS